ncbi:MAG: aminopeptidase [Syntrophomonadaceae bacterium]|nr:aminopeptidase [Syntrophomonadaceae bacterium]
MAGKKEAERNNAWLKMDEKQLQEAYDLSEGYLQFLNKVKTEREAVEFITQTAAESGFINIDSVEKLRPGDKAFLKVKSKVCALLVMGEDSLERGMNIVASHIDSPRLDLKPKPVYEADGLAMFKTHYYGGIKKYQWLAMPLALHGIVVKKDGQVINVCIGEGQNDCVFTITDLLPHLAKDQMEKKLADAVKGEDLNVLIGSRPLREAESDPVKQHIMEILHEKYNIKQDDFASAELEIVPAYSAREVGFDRSMIGAYGQDDRVCAYTSLKAALEVEKPKRTALCLFADKEEIGSCGNTGLHSLMIENIMAELLYKVGQSDYYTLRKTLASSCALSADVNAAVDPTYPDVFEKMNCSFLSSGVVLTKYTGSRGKVDSNDANPEFLGRIRKLFDDNQIVWQVGELGKVDIGGGGTVAKYMAYYGMEVVDCGVAVLGMHSPFEVVSKADIYMAYKGYKAFLQLF